MFDWLSGLDNEKMVLLGTGAGAMIGAAFAAWQGVKRGKATAPAIEAAAAAAMCRAGEAAPEIAKLHERLDDMADGIEVLRDLLIRIEDRTRPR